MTIRPVFFLTPVIFLLCSCGQKGPLYLPKKEASNSYSYKTHGHSVAQYFLDKKFSILAKHKTIYIRL